MFNIKLNCYILIIINIDKINLKDLNKIRLYTYYCNYTEEEKWNKKTIKIIINKKSNI